MELRGLDQGTVLSVIQTGEIKPKSQKNKFWVYREIPGREDNMISVSISIEAPHLIVITTMIRWRPL